MLGRTECSEGRPVRRTQQTANLVTDRNSWRGEFAAALNDQRQRDAERGHAQRRCRFEAEGAALAVNKPGLGDCSFLTTGAANAAAWANAERSCRSPEAGSGAPGRNRRPTYAALPADRDSWARGCGWEHSRQPRCRYQQSWPPVAVLKGAGYGSPVGALRLRVVNDHGKPHSRSWKFPTPGVSEIELWGWHAGKAGPIGQRWRRAAWLQASAG